MAYIDTDDHGVAELLFKVQTVEVLLEFRVHLLEQIRINGNRLFDRWNKQELRRDALRVQFLLGLGVLVRIAN